MKRQNYPFTAIVGQERMKKALLLNAINPAIGGVLIKGEKGTAKSTAVRALADVLPPIDAVKDCQFRCDPEEPGLFCSDCMERQAAGETLATYETRMKVVELPVNATEDRVVGTLDLEHAIAQGKKKFEPGILADANRNILYVDEINLLDDHVVDVLLDAAAMGVNTVEREGVSMSHPAKFVLIGTMNPEEGDIRPQLLDRFGLSVEVVGEHDAQQRVEVIKRRLAYEADPEKFAEEYAEEQKQLEKKIHRARVLLPTVQVPDEALAKTAELSVALDVDGHRADITMLKTAMTIAAFDGRSEVTLADLKAAAELVLPHRMRRKPFEETGIDFTVIDQVLNVQAS
ncbi:MAG: ATP-binding protein [Negativicoccus massiliensis]|nr:ATP-binding protein [Negativicoccus succinicivorans]MDU4641923.1 ATP-binding protein [Negativicoccus massiliensis]